MKEAEEKLARLEDWLHTRRLHPDYEYDTTTGPRKAWNNASTPPEGEGWVSNTTIADPDAWERFEYHEESYWRRLKEK